MSSYDGKSVDYNSISVEFALFGGWVRIMDMIPAIDCAYCASAGLMVTFASYMCD